MKRLRCMARGEGTIASTAAEVGRPIVCETKGPGDVGTALFSGQLLQVNSLQQHGYPNQQEAQGGCWAIHACFAGCKQLEHS
jgi:hypothetical protein